MTWSNSTPAISLRPEGGLTQVPAGELARLRSSRRHSLEMAPRTPFQVPVSDQFELLASFTSVGESTVGIAIFDDDGPEPEARIAFRPGQRRVSVTRRGTVEVGGPDESNVMIIPPDPSGPPACGRFLRRCRGSAGLAGDLVPRPRRLNAPQAESCPMG